MLDVGSADALSNLGRSRERALYPSCHHSSTMANVGRSANFIEKLHG